MRYVLLGAFLCATIVLPAASLDYLASGQVELVSDADGENLRRAVHDDSGEKEVQLVTIAGRRIPAGPCQSNLRRFTDRMATV